MKLTIKIFLYSIIFFTCVMFTACSGSAKFTSRGKTDQTDKHVKPSGNNGNDLSEFNNLNILESQTGVASYYGKKFNGRKTASGEKYNMYALTAAHVSYPFNTIVRVTNLKNNKVVIVRINDRYPVTGKRLIDLSYEAAKTIGMIQSGITDVKLDVLKWGNK